MLQRSNTRKSGQPSGIYAVVGSDDGQVKARARALAAELTPKDAGDFGLDVIDGAADNAEQAVTRLRLTTEAIQTLPFFGTQKLVWLKDVSFLSDTVTGRSASVQVALEEFNVFLDHGLPEGVTFLLNAAEIDRRRTFYKSLVKLGKVEVFDRIDISKPGWEEDAQVLVHQMASELGLRFSPDAMALFVRLAGVDSRQLRSELEKIDLYLADKRDVRIEIVRQLVARSTSGVIWDLGNCIARRNLAESLALLDQLLFQGETPIGILFAAIIPTARNLLVVRDLLDRHGLKPPHAPYQFSAMLQKLPEPAIRHLPRRKDGSLNAYALGIAACEAHRFSVQKLVAGLEACLQANLQLVTTQLEPKLVLSQLLVKLLA
jgi:DNA polymerase III subunit delta